MQVESKTEVFSTGAKPAPEVMFAETIKVLEKTIAELRERNITPEGILILVPYVVEEENAFGVMETSFGNKHQILEMLQKVTIGKIEQELNMGVGMPADFEFTDDSLPDHLG